MPANRSTAARPAAARRRAGALLALTAACALLPAAPALADATFSAPQELGVADRQDRLPLIALDGPGNALATFRFSRGTIDASHNVAETERQLLATRRPAGGAFGDFQSVLAIPDAASPYDSAAVGTGRGGDAVTAWAVSGDPSVAIASGSTTDGYGAPITRTAGTTTAGSPAIAVADDGAALVAWAVDVGSGPSTTHRIAYVRRPAGGAFGPVEVFPYALSARPYQLAADLDGAGRALLTWAEDDLFRTAAAPAGGGFDPAVTLDGFTEVPAARLAGDGTAVYAGPSTAAAIHVVTRAPGGAPTAPITVEEPSFDEVESAVVSERDEQGAVTFAWTRRAPLPTASVRVATWTPGSGIGALRTVAAPAAAAVPRGVQLAVRGGAVAVAWSDDDPRLPSIERGRVFAAHAAPGEPFGAAQLLQGGLYRPLVAVGLDGDGDGVVSWSAPLTNSDLLPVGANHVVAARFADFAMVRPQRPGDPQQPADPGRPQPPAADRTAPSLTGLSLTRARFAVGPRPTALAAAARRPARRAPAGTTVRLRLSEPAAVTVTVERRTVRRSGRRVHVRWVRVGALRRGGLGAGAQRIAFSGRLGRRALKPGAHRFALVARDAAGNASAVRRIAFSIAPR